MILRGIDFGNVLIGSGTQGFFGEGYWFHRLLRLNFIGTTFVSKTTTLHRRKGNMPLFKDGITPEEWMPKCIRVYPMKGLILNSVSLSGPGAYDLFARGLWQRREKPFFISFMSARSTPEEREYELLMFGDLFRRYLSNSNFKASVGLEVSLSCPNVGLNPSELTKEATSVLDDAAYLGIPVVLNFNPTVPVDFVAEIAKHPACDAISIANTVPWGELPELIDWKKLFGTDVSPLAELDGGGLSGWPLLPIVAGVVRKVRELGVTKPIIAGGGIMRRKDVDILVDAGAEAIKVAASISMLRWWRLKGVIRHANHILP